MILALILLIVAVLVLAIWNFITFRKIKKQTGNDEIKDARYWELHYKMDYLVAVAVMGAAALAFFGYESLTSAKESVKSEFDKELITVRDDINKTELILKTLQQFSDSVKNSVSTSDVQISRQKITLETLGKRIEAINSRNIVRQEFYVVRSLTLKTDHHLRPGENTVYFKNLTTELGDQLPRFKRQPLVIPISLSNYHINVYNITNESFEVWYGDFVDSKNGQLLVGGPDDVENIPYSLVVIGQ